MTKAAFQPYVRDPEQITAKVAIIMDDASHTLVRTLEKEVGEMTEKQIKKTSV